MDKTLKLRAGLLSCLLLLVLVGIWHAATQATASGGEALDPEYAMLMGLSAESERSSGFPTPGEFASSALGHLASPFYDNGPNDKGIGIQLAHSLWRVAAGFLLAMAVAIPLGFVIGMSPLLYQLSLIHI